MVKSTQPAETDREFQGWPEFDLGEIQRRYIGESRRVRQCRSAKRKQAGKEGGRSVYDRTLQRSVDGPLGAEKGRTAEKKRGEKKIMGTNRVCTHTHTHTQHGGLVVRSVGESSRSRLRNASRVRKRRARNGLIANKLSSSNGYGRLLR